MKKAPNFFAQWRHGQWISPKVYIVRIYYDDIKGMPQTCLKLGFTKQPLHNRIIRFLNEMRKATGFKIKQYELVSLLYTSSYSSLEYALHSNHLHLVLINASGIAVCYDGSGELLYDTPENCNLIQQPNSFYDKGKYIVPYNYREPKKRTIPDMDNVV